MNSQFVSADMVAMKDGSSCQTLGQFTGLHFPELKWFPDHFPDQSSYNVNIILKFDLNVSTKVKFNADEQGL